jgi:hypothetical protein
MREMLAPKGANNGEGQGDSVDLSNDARYSGSLFVLLNLILSQSATR